jgi:predicted DNA-binding protein with PD1-like motif
MSKTIMQRLRKGEDLVAELTRVCRENGVTRGSVQVIGAMEQARLGYYHQDARKYETHAIDKHVEILSGIGNVSLLDGEVFVHLHLTLSDDACQCMGGHAMEGNIIFAAEAIVTEIPGNALNRVYDEPTGLKLWG